MIGGGTACGRHRWSGGGGGAGYSGTNGPGDHLFPIWMVWDDWGGGDHQYPGGLFVAGTDGPGGPIMRGGGGGGGGGPLVA